MRLQNGAACDHTRPFCLLDVATVVRYEKYLQDMLQASELDGRGNIRKYLHI
jgi:hypothetical protein